MYVGMYVRMYVCMYVSIYLVSVYVRMCVHVRVASMRQWMENNLKDGAPLTEAEVAPNVGEQSLQVGPLDQSLECVRRRS